MPVDQQAVQTAVTQQGGAQPATAGGAVAPAFNVAGNPNTAYNYAPPQANAAGEWWAPQGNVVSPLVQALMNQTYNRQYAPVPVVPPTEPVPTVPPVVQPPVTNVPPVEGPTGGVVIPGVPVTRPTPEYPYGRYPIGRRTGRTTNQGYIEDMGGDGSYCVEEDMVLMDRDNNQYWADELSPGMEFLCHIPELGFHSSKVVAKGNTVWQECVEITTELGAKLVCSSNTPFTFVGASKDLNEGEWAHAEDMLGKLVYVKRGDQLEAEKVAIVAKVGPKRVVPLDFGGKSFAAGVSSTALIFSHNIRKIPGSGVDLIGLAADIQSQFGVSFGNSPYISTLGEQNGYNTTGGYLGSGSYEGMGQGLAAAGYPAAGPVTYGTQAPVPQVTAPLFNNLPTGGTGNAWDEYVNPTTAPSTNPWEVYGYTNPTTPAAPVAPAPAPTNSWWQNGINLISPVPIFNQGQFDPLGGIKADWQEFIRTGN